MKKLTITAAVILLAMLLIGSRARHEPEEWEEYTVKSGDTISGIAVEITPETEDYRDNMRYIVDKNNIENGLIFPGQVIFVPMEE